MRRRTTGARARRRVPLFPRSLFPETLFPQTLFPQTLFPQSLRRDRTFALWVVMCLLTAYPASTAPVTTYLPLAPVRLAVWFVGNYLLWRLLPTLLVRLVARVRRAGAVQAAGRHCAGRAGSSTSRRVAGPRLLGDGRADAVGPVDPPSTRPVSAHARTPAASPNAPTRPRGMFEPVQPWVGPAAALTEACLLHVRPDLRSALRSAVGEAVILGMSHAVVEAGTTDLPPATPAWGVRAAGPHSSAYDERHLPLDDVPRILALAKVGGYRWMRRPELDPLEVFGPASHELTS